MASKDIEEQLAKIEKKQEHLQASLKKILDILGEISKHANITLPSRLAPKDKE